MNNEKEGGGECLPGEVSFHVRRLLLPPEQLPCEALAASWRNLRTAKPFDPHCSS